MKKAWGSAISFLVGVHDLRASEIFLSVFVKKLLEKFSDPLSILVLNRKLLQLSPWNLNLNHELLYIICSMGC